MHARQPAPPTAPAASAAPAAALPGATAPSPPAAVPPPPAAALVQLLGRAERPLGLQRMQRLVGRHRWPADATRKAVGFTLTLTLTLPLVPRRVTCMTTSSTTSSWMKDHLGLARQVVAWSGVGVGLRVRV